LRIAQLSFDRISSPFALLTSLPLTHQRAALREINVGLFPLVGLVLGGLLVGLDWLVQLALPSVASSAVVVVALVALTGALHLDGLADSADGLFGGRDREHRLMIMRDPRVGAFGFVAIATVLLLKWAALIELEGWLRIGALLIVPMLARWSLVPAVLFGPSARPEGMAAMMRSSRPWTTLVLSTAVVMGVSLAIFWPTGVVLVAIATLPVLLVGLYAVNRLGGLTGDVLGAIVELSEAFLLLVIATSASHSWLT
jgi:adenosylcobinamide-GDP ribazoletransferase